MKTKILDCTLRDGSYSLNFSFDASDTYNIVKNLSDVGINFIEIGHGLGQGASKNTKYKARCSDKQYLKSTEKLKNSVKWGVFCIPGIASFDDLKMALDHGCKFFRVGSNLENYKDQEKYINYLKKHQVVVCSNLMKSYLLKPKPFSKITHEMNKMGADVVYLVDSAGSMFPKDIEDYFYEIKNINKNIKLGFHGHDNLGLSNANALMAHKLGFDIIDCSLQGIGRSAGNTGLEQFVSCLLMNKVDLDIDILKLIEISEKYIIKKHKYLKIDPLDLIMGLTQFHSSYMEIIQKYAKKYKVDPKKMIIMCSKINNNETTELIAEKIAKKIKSENNKKFVWKHFYKNYFGKEQSILEDHGKKY